MNAGRALPYPPTPALAPGVMTRIAGRQRRSEGSVRRTWILAALLAVLLVLFVVPPARAAILDFLQVGVVRIFGGPAPAPMTAPTALPAMQIPMTATQASLLAVTSLPPSLPDLAGATTLAEAQSAVDFPVLLPSYPADLGRPDHVYLQHPGDSMVILVWLEGGASGPIRMSLQEIGPGSWQLSKFNPRVLQETTVNGQPAAWVEGPYMLEMRNGNYLEQSLIAGHVLIWQEGKVTYRLEAGISLEEAIKVAESLKPVP